MTRLQFVAAIVCAALVLWGSDARAATSEPRIALVVGNAAYQNAPPLKNPLNDARDMAKALRELGFDVIQVENASKQQLEHAIGEFSAKLSEGSVGLFYYSGHGIQENGRNFLIPVDANLATEAAVRLEAVEVDLVLELMNLAQTRVNLVILDACRSNPFERRFRSIGRGLAPVEQAPRGTLVAYSTAPGKVASDGDGPNGLYTAELLRTIRVPGLKVEEVFKAVRIAVGKASHEYQTPWESSSLTGDFFFNPPAPPLTPPRPMSADAAVWDVIKDGSDPEPIAIFLNNYPNSEFASLAKKKLAALSVKAGSSVPQSVTAGPASSTSQIVTPQSEPTIGVQRDGPLETKPLRSQSDASPITVAVVSPGLQTPGLSSIEIARAQALLAALGFLAGNADGKLGAKTTNAIKEFQREQNLKVSGEIDQELLRQLEAAQSTRQGNRIELPSQSEAKVMTELVSPKVTYTTSAEEADRRGDEALARSDYDEALRLFNFSSALGDARGNYSIGRMSMYGLGLRQSLKFALLKFRQAADQGYAPAEVSLASMFEAGTGVKQDYAEALRLYGLAAEQGDMSAYLHLGQMHEKGLGVSPDRDQAIKWYRLAAVKGDGSAMISLERLNAASAFPAQQVAISPVPSTVNSASQSPQSPALVPPVPSVSLAISAETLKKLAVPLDGGMIIEFQKPPPNVGQEYADFVGAWTGNWNSSLSANLFIESVSITGDARGIYQWGTNRNIKEPGIISFQGKIVNGVVSWKSSNTSFEFTLQADGKMAGKHFRANIFDFSIVMTKLQ